MATLVLQLSVAPTAAVGSDVPHSSVRPIGQVTTGAMVSSTTMLWVASVKLPQSSVTRYTRVTVPGQLPTSTPLLITENVNPAEQVSLATPPAARNAARSAYGGGTSSVHWTEML